VQRESAVQTVAPDPLEPPACQDHLDHKEREDALDLRASKDRLELMAHQDHRDRPDHRDQLVLPACQELRDLREMLVVKEAVDLKVFRAYEMLVVKEAVDLKVFRAYEVSAEVMVPQELPVLQDPQDVMAPSELRDPPVLLDQWEHQASREPPDHQDLLEL